MEELQKHLPIQLSEQREIRIITPGEAQQAIELKQISIAETYKHWADPEEIRQEVEIVASREWIDRQLEKPDFLLLGQWQNRHLQAIGGLERTAGAVRLMSGAAWPTSFHLAVPITQARLRLARLLGAERVEAFAIRENQVGKAHLRRHGFQESGSLWKLMREPSWVMIDYHKTLD